MSLKSFQTSFGLDKQHTTSLSSHITSTFQGGAFFGAMFGFAISEWLGRRWNLMSSGVIFLLGALLQTLSHGNLGMMYAGRALTGAGVGASSLIVPIYIAESSPHTVRGRLIGMFEVVLQTASVIGFWYVTPASVPLYAFTYSLPCVTGQDQLRSQPPPAQH